MATADITPEVLQKASETIPENSPVFMVNLLRFRASADYGDQPIEDAPVSGRDAYFQRYATAFNQVAAHVTPDADIRPVWVGTLLASVIMPPGESWDAVVVVEYPSFETLRHILESPEYAAQAAPHHHAAVEDWRWIATASLPLPQRF